MAKKSSATPESPRIIQGNAYGGRYLFPCALSDDCSGVLLWEDQPETNGVMSATVQCSECGEAVDGADVLAAIGSIKRRIEAPAPYATQDP